MYSRLKRLVIAIMVGTLFVGASAYAEVEPSLTDTHINQIRSNCQTAKITLAQIHANDAPTYININQTYFSISDKLMARLNSRLTLNRYDATQLVKVASEYNSNLGKFHTAYKDYDEAMNKVLQINCTKNPEAFYNAVADARQARLQVNTTTKQLSSNIEQYSQQVKSFKLIHAKSLLNGGRNE